MCYTPVLLKAIVVATSVLALLNAWSVFLIVILFHALLVMINDYTEQLFLFQCSTF